jgi:hypothetical protein
VLESDHEQMLLVQHDTLDLALGVHRDASINLRRVADGSLNTVGNVDQFAPNH